MNYDILKLREVYELNSLIPVLGSGLSMPFGLPSWANLIKEAVNYFHIEDKADEIDAFLVTNSYLKAIDVFKENGIKESDLQSFIAKYIKDYKKKVDSKSILSNYPDLNDMLKVRYLTTNYDEYLEEFISNNNVILFQNLHMLSINDFRLKRYNHTIIPLHGTVSEPDQIIFTKESYEKLYTQDSFNADFQLLKNSYTFLFIGFSFDDVYFKSLFDKLTSRYKSTHYILFPYSILNSEDGTNKIKLLKTEYGVNSIFYGGSHIEGIKDIIKQIVYFSDSKINVKEMKKLKYKKSLPIIPKLKGVCDELSRAELAFSKRRIGGALAIYLDVYNNLNNYKLDEDQQNLLLQRIIFCYAEKYQFDEAMKYASGINMQSIRIAPLFLRLNLAELFLNKKMWKEALYCLKGDKDKIAILLRECIKTIKRFLPCQDSYGLINIYGKDIWSKSKKTNRHKSYLNFIKKFVDLNTYELISLDQYVYGNAQESAYYWLGIVAGQLFHEHKEAIQLIYRAYEISKFPIYYEEMGKNYLFLAKEKLIGNTNPKLVEVDFFALTKAEECFRFAFKIRDSEYRESLYKSCGYAYLETLYFLRHDLEFLRFFPKVIKYLDNTDIYYKKAEIDARFTNKCYLNILEKLTKRERLIVKCIRDSSKAYKFKMEGNLENHNNLVKKYIKEITKYPDFEKDRDLMLQLIDAYYNINDLDNFKKSVCKFKLNFNITDNYYMAMEYELEKKFDYAERIYKDEFEKAPSIPTFNLYNNFLQRCNYKDKVYKLYKDIDEIYHFIINDLNDFYYSWIMTAIQYNDIDLAFSLYDKFCLQIKDDMLKEITEKLYSFIGDYSSCDERVEYIRNLLGNVSDDVEYDLYQRLFYLYINNFRLKETKEILDVIKERGYPYYTDDYHRFCVMIGRCTKEFYRPKLNTFYSFENTNSYLKRVKNPKQIICKLIELKDKRVVLPIWVLAIVFGLKVTWILDGLKEIFISECGYTSLKLGLWKEENFYHRILMHQIHNAKNTTVFSVPLINFCKTKEKYPDLKNFEYWQIIAYHKMNPDIECPIKFI